ncbi:MAG TPA: universal stress protein [Rhodocyclaceae bacterium]|nr:universal stress protein [Rhodocyclaceae bacterium]
MYKQILVAIDDSQTAQCALQEAAGIAQAHGASLQITHVVDESLLNIHKSILTNPEALEQARRALVEGGAKLLADAKQAVTNRIDASVKLLESRSHRVSEILAQEAEDGSADLIVIGTHGRRGLSKLLVGSVAEQVVRAAQCSVLLVRKH